MAQLRLDLNEEELTDLARQIQDVANVLDDADEIETIGGQLDIAVGLADSVYEWVARARGVLARQGISA